MRVGKIWGTTETLLSTTILHIERMSILPKSQCSLHMHHHKWNGFLVLSGRLKIEVHKNNYALVDVTEIGPGEFTAVKPGEYHRFVSGDAPVNAIEIYYPETLSEDIVRKDVGTRLTQWPVSKPSTSASRSLFSRLWRRHKRRS